MPENLWTFICSYPVSYKSEEKLVEWIIDAMQEYADQFHNLQPIEQPEQKSTEEIDVGSEVLSKFVIVIIILSPLLRTRERVDVSRMR